MIFFEFSTRLAKNSVDIVKIPEILLNFASAKSTFPPPFS